MLYRILLTKGVKSEGFIGRILAILLAIFISAFSGVAQTATASATEGCVPLTVNFDGKGSNYNWASGNGSVSNGTEKPTFIYGTAGTYTAVARDVGTNAVVNSFTIDVYDMPTITISADVTNGCVPFAVSFDTLGATSIPYTNANWVFGDGTGISSSTAAATHTYANTGSFTVAVQLESNLSGCDLRTSVPNMITTVGAPDVEFEFSPESSCSTPVTVAFTNLTTDVSSLSYAWDFGDGATETDESPSHTYTAEGTYTVELTATNASGCSASVTEFYTINQPSAVIDAPDTVCLNAGQTFSEVTGGNAVWDFSAASGVFVVNNDGDFEPITSTDEESVEVYFRQAGNQTVELQLNSSCGNESVTKTIFVQELSIDPVLDKAYSCENPVDVVFDVNTDAENATFQWIFSDGTDTLAQSVTRTYYEGADTIDFGIIEQNLDTAYLVVTQPASATRALCFDTVSVTFEHFPLNVKAEPDGGFNNLCEGTTLSFTDSIAITTTIDLITGLPIDAISTWRWQIYDESNTQVLEEIGTGPTIDVLDHDFDAGSYKIYLDATTTTGCTDTSFAVDVMVGEPLTGGVDFDFDTFDSSGTPETNFCIGDEVTYSVTLSDPRIDAFHFYSDNNRVFHQPEDTTVTWTLGTDLGSHDVTLEVEVDGCLSSHTINNQLNINGAVAEVTYEASCDYNYQFISASRSFPSTATTLSWEFRDDNTTAASATVSHDYAPVGAGDYRVVLTADDAASGCASDVDSVLVTPRLAIADIEVKDTLVCGGSEIVISAGNTEGQRSCRGLTFRFPTFESIQRPITTFDSENTDSVTVTIPDYDELDIPNHFFQVIATDDNGCRDTINSDTIRASFIRVGADLNDTTITCKGIELTFSDTTTSSTSTLTEWEWKIWSGDLSLVDTIQGDDAVDTISYTFLEEPVGIDSFFVALQVTGDDGCRGGVRDTLAILPYIRLNSRIVSEGNNDALCDGDDARFSGRDRQNQGLDFAWDFGNLETDTTFLGGEVTETDYPIPGEYTVTMRYFQPSTGCADTLTRTVDVESAPNAGFETSVDGLAAICAGEIIEFRDASRETTGSVARVFWDLDNGDTGNDPTYTTIFEKGTFNVTLEASTDNGCTGTATRSFFIVGPEGDIVVDDNLICPDDSVLFTIENPVDVASIAWVFGDGTVDTTDQFTAQHQYLEGNIPSFNSILATSVLISSNGCERALDEQINFFRVAAAFQPFNEAGLPDSIHCENETVLLSEASLNADRFTWDFGDGSGSTEASPSHLFPAPGSYTIQQISENVAEGCVDTTTSSITILGIEDLNLQFPNDTICLGETFSASLIQPNDASSYLWTPSGATGSSMSFEPENTFTLTVEATNEVGCVSSLDRLITVIQPYAFNDWDTTIQEGKNAILPVVLLDSSYFFELTPVEGLSCLDCSFPSVSPSEDISYNLRIQSPFGCFDDNYSLTVFVIPPSFISMPQSFSPNGDGVNDVIYVKGWELEELMEFQVYNRWGELMFSTTNMEEGWNGTFKGRIQKTDIYVYKIKALGTVGDIVQKEGYINLIK